MEKNLTEDVLYFVFEDLYRRHPSSENIDLNGFKHIQEPTKQFSSWWQLLLMIEDEINRSKTGGFQLVHPNKETSTYYNRLFRVPRFSDHLLAKWQTIGGIEGEGFQYLPAHIRSLFPSRNQRQKVLSRPSSSIRKVKTQSNPVTPRTLDAQRDKVAAFQDWKLFQRIHRNIYDECTSDGFQLL